MALYFTDDEAYGVVVGWIPVTRFVRLVLARRFLAKLERGATAFLHDNLLVTLGKDFILVPRSIARTAGRRRVPAANIAGFRHRD